MDPNEARRRRRAGNRAARAVFDEARRAGLVRRHLLKLRHLADHPPDVGNPRRTADSLAPAAGNRYRTAEPLAPAATARRRRKQENAVQLALDFAQPAAPEGEMISRSTSDATSSGSDIPDAA